MMQRGYYQQDPEREPLDNPYQGAQSPGGYSNQGPDYDQFRHHAPTRGGANQCIPGAQSESQFYEQNQNPQVQHDPRYYPAPIHEPNTQSHITPGADNFGYAASGGMAGIAYSVAEQRARESGMDPTRNGGPPNPSENPFAGGSSLGGSSHSSIATGPAGMGATALPRSRTPQEGYGYDEQPINPYQGYRREDGRLGVVNPHEIADDGDDGLEYKPPARTSMLSLQSNRSSRNGQGAMAAGAVAGAAGGAAVAGGLAGKSAMSGMQYDVIRSGSPALGGSGQATNNNVSGILAEKESDWLAKQHGGRKKWKWVISIVVVLIIVGAVVGGVIGGLVSNDDDGDDEGGQSAEDDEAENGDLNINSEEIQELLGNEALHKVFPGIDYTPLNTQYPDCYKWPPSQNNVTRDIAVLSQLTNTVRLYGTDCNQTQMVIHAIQQLEMEDTMKVWMGVWQDSNTTTNSRQLEQMWDILDEYGTDSFAGIIVANEILFREEMTLSELSTLLADVRTNLTAKGIDLPVATSDLGDDLAQSSAIGDNSDYIMANIHPFFAQVTADTAAAWTLQFWEEQLQDQWKSDTNKNVIAEIGWPSDGGTNEASVASVDGMNTLLEDWVCAALSNSTQYFWFSAFDEPWKASFNEEGKEWEDKWGLMDVNRNLKDGLTIPDCDGVTID